MVTPISRHGSAQASARIYDFHVSIIQLSHGCAAALPFLQLPMGSFVSGAADQRVFHNIEETPVLSGHSLFVTGPAGPSVVKGSRFHIKKSSARDCHTSAECHFSTTSSRRVLHF